MINKILESLAADSSRLAKEAILTENKGNDQLKLVFSLALDPYRNFYIKKIPKYIPDSSLFKRGLDEAIVDLEDLSSRKVTGNAAISHLQDILNSLNSDDAEVIVKIIRRNLRCGVSVSTVNKIWPDLVEEYPCMLCTAYDEKVAKKIKFRAIFQVKEDGLRFNAIVKSGACDFRARSGSPIELKDDSLAKEFVKLANGQDVVFDGEMVGFRDGKLMPRKEGNGIATKAIKGTITEEESKLLHVILWDVVPLEDFMKKRCDTPYEDRLADLTAKVALVSGDLISLVESKIVHNMDEVQELFMYYLELGLEGGILKNLHAIWEDGRSKDQIKFKAEKECDLRVRGWNFGEVGSKYETILGSLLCESEDGKVVANISGFSDHQRNTITPENSIDRIVTILYNERITKKNGGVDSLFLPRIVCFRDDKFVADDSTQIK